MGPKNACYFMTICDHHILSVENIFVISIA